MANVPAELRTRVANLTPSQGRTYFVDANLNAFIRSSFAMLAPRKGRSV